MLQGEHSAILSTFIKLPFGLNIFIHISIYSNIQIYILQYNHDGIQKKSCDLYESVSLKLPFVIKIFVLSGF